jgi:hypothetical protein
MRHARDANELLEVASDELRAIVGDDSRLGFQVLLLGSLQYHLDIGFSHRLTQISMHEETTESIQNAAHASHISRVLSRYQQSLQILGIVGRLCCR